MMPTLVLCGDLLMARLWLVVLGLATIGFAGCSRQQFRERADKDVEGVITQKNIDPTTKVENWHVYPDPRSRFADPSCPDFPPYPPDDYYAWLTSPNPQRPGRGGAGRHEGDLYLRQLEAWDATNRAEDAAANPEKPKPKEEQVESVGAAAGAAAATFQAVYKSDEQPLRIRLDQAVELALFNSREFQDRREDLYLAALPVTLERFSFAAQAFASEQIIRESTGRSLAGAGEAWRLNTDAGISRRLATGGELLVRLANQVVIDLSGNNPQVSLSNLGFTFLQPFLRGGGLAVTLEALTQAERTLLYAIRSYARFRKVFYVAIAGQGDYTNNPYGLQGLSANLGRGVGANLTARPTGFMPTVLRGATLANERKNVKSLEQFLLLFENLKEGGGVNELQVVRVEQNLLRSRNTVLISTRLYLDNIDFFKLQLGLPATIPLELDDAPLKPVRRQLSNIEQVYDQLRDVEVATGKFDEREPAIDLRKRWLQQLTESPLARGTAFAKDYPTRATELRKELDDALQKQVVALNEVRRKLLDARAERQGKNQPEPASASAELEGVESAVDRIRFEQSLRRYEMQPWLRVAESRRSSERASWFRSVFEAGMLVAIQPRNQRLSKLRDAWPNLPELAVDGVDLLTTPLDEGYVKVSQAALINRLDLMNARAQVVDQWRRITVAANSLQGNFDVRYDLNASTPVGGNAGFFDVSGARTQHTVTLRLEPPFVRREERNQYRASLIAYQRQRRNLQAFEDNILTDTRQDLRNLRQLAETYVIQQRAIELGYAQVDNARSTFTAPPDPGVRESAGNVAALTQQLLDAQSALLQAQNDLYTTWMTYLTTRMDLYLDMELLPLDARGLWTNGLSQSDTPINVERSPDVPPAPRGAAAAADRPDPAP